MLATLEQRSKRSNTLMSLCEPGIPKNACQNYRSLDTTASKTIVGFDFLPVYCPAHAVGQFFQTQCMQSRLPSIPTKPRLACVA
jgi:hypothetical protein